MVGGTGKSEVLIGLIVLRFAAEIEPVVWFGGYPDPGVDGDPTRSEGWSG